MTFQPAAQSTLPIPPVCNPSAGDEQSLSASLSTFSGHLRRISALRAESGSRSLVLLDEVGTGAGCFVVVEKRRVLMALWSLRK